MAKISADDYFLCVLYKRESELKLFSKAIYQHLCMYMDLSMNVDGNKSKRVKYWCHNK